jgi:hypothetical protein
LGGGVLVRSTLRPEKQVEFTDAEWATFILAAQGGEFDLP